MGRRNVANKVINLYDFERNGMVVAVIRAQNNNDPKFTPHQNSSKAQFIHCTITVAVNSHEFNSSI